MVGGKCSLLPYGTGICHYITFFKFDIVSVHSFFIFFFNMVSINEMEWSTIPACPSLMCSFNRGNIEGTNSENLCLVFVYLCFMFAK